MTLSFYRRGKNVYVLPAFTFVAIQFSAFLKSTPTLEVTGNKLYLQFFGCSNYLKCNKVWFENWSVLKNPLPSSFLFSSVPLRDFQLSTQRFWCLWNENLSFFHTMDDTIFFLWRDKYHFQDIELLKIRKPQWLKIFGKNAHLWKKFLKQYFCP